MKVVDHGPQTWFLLAEQDRLYLDARVSRSAVEWGVLIELSPQERAGLAAQGKPYLDALAASIDAAPERYAARDLGAARGREVAQVVVAWREAGTGEAADAKPRESS